MIVGRDDAGGVIVMARIAMARDDVRARMNPRRQRKNKRAAMRSPRRSVSASVGAGWNTSPPPLALW